MHSVAASDSKSHGLMSYSHILVVTYSTARHNVLILNVPKTSYAKTMRCIAYRNLNIGCDLNITSGRQSHYVWIFHELTD